MLQIVAAINWKRLLQIEEKRSLTEVVAATDATSPKNGNMFQRKYSEAALSASMFPEQMSHMKIPCQQSIEVKHRTNKRM